MNLYCTPGGTWAGSLAAWTTAMKAEGRDPKEHEPSTFDVPTSPKAALMEWLTFHNVNPMRAQQIAPEPAAVPAATDDSAATTVSDLDVAFEAAPIPRQLDLAVAAIDRANAALRS